jgi:uncharacterized membrane protein YhfC
MPGIYVMAGLTILVTAMLSLTALNTLTQRDRRYYWLIITGLPLSLIVNRLVKIPLVTGIGAWANVPLKLGPDTPLWFIAVIWLAAPVFEEGFKMLPMALAASRVLLSDAARALAAGLALGIGFGLGEAAYLAYGIAQSPAYNQLPWYMFTGFAVERLSVTFGHGLLTSIAVLGLYHGRRKMLIGYLAAVGLHALLNLGPILLTLKAISATVASAGTYAAILVAFVIFQNEARKARRISGSAPEEIVYFDLNNHSQQ